MPGFLNQAQKKNPEHVDVKGVGVFHADDRDVRNHEDDDEIEETELADFAFPMNFIKSRIAK